jgi:hypothetical protein
VVNAQENTKSVAAQLEQGIHDFREVYPLTKKIQLVLACDLMHELKKELASISTYDCPPSNDKFAGCDITSSTRLCLNSYVIAAKDECISDPEEKSL